MIRKIRDIRTRLFGIFYKKVDFRFYFRTKLFPHYGWFKLIVIAGNRKFRLRIRSIRDNGSWRWPIVFYTRPFSGQWVKSEGFKSNDLLEEQHRKLPKPQSDRYVVWR